MTGTILLKKLNKKQRSIMSEKDFDTRIGGDFWIILDPLIVYDDTDNETPAFYYKKRNDGQYIIEGEMYIFTNIDSARAHRNRTNKEYPTVNYIEDNTLRS